MVPPPPSSTLFPYTTLFRSQVTAQQTGSAPDFDMPGRDAQPVKIRSEEHTSELQSHHDLVCRLLLEKKKTRREINKDGLRNMITRAVATLASGALRPTHTPR